MLEGYLSMSAEERERSHLVRRTIEQSLGQREAAERLGISRGAGWDVDPRELARREKRLAEIARAKAVIEARARQRHAHKRAEYDAKMAAREAKTATTGKKPGGREPQPPAEGPLRADQVNLTDDESRITPVAGGGFEQCYNAQAAVAADSLLVVASAVVQAPNDKQQLAPMLGKIAELPGALGKVGELLTDNGYFSEANVNACAAAGIEPVIAMGREAHHPSLAERFAEDPPEPENPTPLDAMRHRLQTKAGKKLLRPAQADARANIWDHQVGAWVPSVYAAWPRQSAPRVKPCDHGVEPEADVRPGRGRTELDRAFLRHIGTFVIRAAVVLRWLRYQTRIQLSTHPSEAVIQAALDLPTKQPKTNSDSLLVRRVTDIAGSRFRLNVLARVATSHDITAESVTRGTSDRIHVLEGLEGVRWRWAGMRILLGNPSASD